jgi:PAS domain S-box-containing protein
MGAPDADPIRVALVSGAHSDTLASSLADGHERVVVESMAPDAAREAAVAGEVDCVVCGQDLDGTTGVDFLTAVAERRPAIPTFLYPAAADPDAAAGAVAAGVTEYLPAGEDGVDPEQLADRVATAVDEYRRDRDRAENERRYQTMLDTVGDLVYTLDPDGNFTFINETGAQLTGYDRDDLVGAHVSLVLSEADIDAGRDLIEDLWRTADMRRGTIEMALQTADGATIPCENHIALLPPRDGEFVGTVGVMRDISERKRREEALEALHDATREMMAAERADEVAAIASSTATEVLDMPLNTVLLYDEETDSLRSAALSDLTADLFGSPIEFERDEGLVWDAYEDGATRVYSDVSAAPDAYNPETPARSEFILPLGDHGAMIVGSQSVGDFDESDVALAKIHAANLQAALTTTHREQTLRERERQLERQNERLDEFASVVSHDLRNPLNVAQGRLELYAETGEDAHREQIETAHERMGEIVDEVLALAREGRTVSELEPVDVEGVADAAWSNVATDGASLDASAAPVVEGDPNRVQQLLENLFRNSVEHGSTYSPQAEVTDGASSAESDSTAPRQEADGGPDHESRDRSAAVDDGDVTIRVGPLDDGFYVADDGPGIPVAERDAVFESGFSTSSGGSGFGLAIVEQIATAHGWDVAIRESWAGGARFEVRDVQLA